jgi:hypothetical protein
MLDPVPTVTWISCRSVSVEKKRSKLNVELKDFCVKRYVGSHWTVENMNVLKYVTMDHASLVRDSHLVLNTVLVGETSSPNSLQANKEHSAQILFLLVIVHVKNIFLAQSISV